MQNQKRFEGKLLPRTLLLLRNLLYLTCIIYRAIYLFLTQAVELREIRRGHAFFSTCPGRTFKRILTSTLSNKIDFHF